MSNIEDLILNLHVRLQRIEIMMGLSKPPEEWDITEERIHKIMEKTGEGYDEILERLVTGFGLKENGMEEEDRK